MKNEMIGLLCFLLFLSCTREITPLAPVSDASSSTGTLSSSGTDAQGGTIGLSSSSQVSSSSEEISVGSSSSESESSMESSSSEILSSSSSEVLKNWKYTGTEIEVFFQNYCNGCHSGISARAGFKTTAYEFLSQENNLSLINKRVVIDGDMPQKSATQPSQQEINNVAEWISQGGLE